MIMGFDPLEVEKYIQERIPPVQPKYHYPGEDTINPAYQDIASIRCPLQSGQIKIWVLRRDLILAIGLKNAYEREYGYTGFKEGFEVSLHRFINFDNRYGHPSLTIPEGSYDGSAYYAGYICQRPNYLQVYLVSGRFERTDLNAEQTSILEAYIAWQFQTVYGTQDVVFDHGDSNDASYHAAFFKDGQFHKDNPQRRYDQKLIQTILENIPSGPSPLPLKGVLQ